MALSLPLFDACLSISLFDACLSISRRFLRNQPIFQADLGHIHHRLLGFGLNPGW